MTRTQLPPDGWLPAGRRAAIRLSIDDVHPGRSSDAYEAGGTPIEPAGDGHWAIVERRGAVARVQAIVCESGALTTDGWGTAFRELSGAGTPAALEAIAGHVFVLRAGDAEPASLAGADWWLHGLDRA